MTSSPATFLTKSPNIEVVATTWSSVSLIWLGELAGAFGRTLTALLPIWAPHPVRANTPIAPRMLIEAPLNRLRRVIPAANQTHNPRRSRKFTALSIMRLIITNGQLVFSCV